MFSDYVKKLADVQKLTPTEEGELWRAYKERGDEAARRRIIESYQPLVFREVMPYRALPAVMDAVQEGTIGLIEAVEHYEPIRGVAFSLFAVHRIRGRMLNFLQKEGRRDIACMDEPRTDGRSPWELLPDPALSVAEQTELGLMTEELHRALARLPQKERLVLEGVYLKSEAVAKIAEVLDVSAAHIYRLQKSGVRRVRGMLSRFMRF